MVRSTELMRLWLVLLATALTAQEAHAADDDELCLASSIEGQVLRRSGRLLRAREHFAECARDACEPSMRERCATWLHEAEASTPRLSLRIVDDRGTPLPKAFVHVDGTEVDASKALEIDPGKHVVRADFAGRREVLDVDLAGKALTPTYEAKLAIDLRSHVSERPTPPVVYVLGGVGGLSAIAFAAFGTSALVQAGHLSECEPYCASARKTPLDTATTGADVALAVSAAATLGAVVLYLARPTISREIRLAPGALAWTF